jgi:hypothetical protein
VDQYEVSNSISARQGLTSAVQSAANRLATYEGTQSALMPRSDKSTCAAL